MIIAELTKFFLHFSQIFFPTDNFSRNCGCFRDISPLRPWFLPDLGHFPGHFTSATVVSPGFAAFSGTFLCSCRDFSRFWGVFRDISPLRPSFLPVLRRFPGHFLYQAVFAPQKTPLIGRKSNTVATFSPENC